LRQRQAQAGERTDAQKIASMNALTIARETRAEAQHQDSFEGAEDEPVR
jgi:hypothetical protein